MMIKTSALSALAGVFSGCYSHIDIEPTDEGWDAYALSDDKTSMMRARLPASAFQGYEPCGRFVVSCKDLSEALKAMGEASDVGFDARPSRMSLESGGLAMTVPLMPSAGGPKRVPSVPLDAGFVCDAAPLRKVVSLSRRCSVRLTLSGGTLTAESMDERGCGPRATVGAEEMEGADGEASAAYGAQALSEFLSRFPKGAMASFELGDDLPLKVAFALDGLEGAFYLAPMIEGGLR